jgi:hypothetical protein
MTNIALQNINKLINTRETEMYNKYNSEIDYIKDLIQNHKINKIEFDIKNKEINNWLRHEQSQIDLAKRDLEFQLKHIENII